MVLYRSSNIFQQKWYMNCLSGPRTTMYLLCPSQLPQPRHVHWIVKAYAAMLSFAQGCCRDSVLKHDGDSCFTFELSCNSMWLRGGARLSKIYCRVASTKRRAKRSPRVGQLCDSIYASCNHWFCRCRGPVARGTFCHSFSKCNPTARISLWLWLSWCWVPNW